VSVGSIETEYAAITIIKSGVYSATELQVT